MNPVTHTKERVDDLLREWEELIKLGEASAAKLDSVDESIERWNILRGAAVILIVSAVCVLAAAVLAIRLTPSGWSEFGLSQRGRNEYGVLVLGSALLTLFGIFLGWTSTRRLRRLNREEMVESKIYERLVTMIDEQKRRVRSEGVISPVTEATMEMRVSRLQR